MPLARRLSGVLAVAAVAPPLYWLVPALFRRLAPSYRDQGDFFYPLKLYTADRLRAGEIPLWNPLSGAGEPWLANGQAGVFYPPSLLFLIPSPAIAAILFLLVHFAIGAWGMRRFLSQEGVSESGALFGAAVFASSGFAASLATYWNHFGAWAWLPVVAAIARAGVRSRGALIALALAVGLQAMAGSPEVSGLTLLIALALSLVPRADEERPWLDSRRSTTARTVGGILLGLAIAAWALVPLGELVLHSDRTGAIPAEEREPGALSARALAIALASAPDATGTFWLPSLLVGPLVLVVAAASFFERDRRALAIVLAAVALAGLLLAAGGPPGSWLRALPPFDRVRYPEKALAATVFGLAGLSGIGFDTLRFRGGDQVPRLVFLLLAAGGLAVVLLVPGPFVVRAATGLGLLIALSLAMGAGRRELAGRLLAGIGSISLVVSYAVANRPLFTFVPESAIREKPRAIESLGRLSGRVLTPPPGVLSAWVVRDAAFDEATLARQRQALAGYTNLLFGVSTVRTAAALPTGGARAIADAVDASDDPVRAAGPASARVLWSPFRPSRLPSRVIGSFFRAPLAPYRPRLSFARTYRVDGDAERAWRRATAGEIDLGREVLLDRDPSPRPAVRATAPLLLARLAEDRPERVVAEITTNAPGVLVVTDLHYPGWIAEENGKRLEILRADGLFRAVALSAGSHRVTFRYRPLSVLVGAAISAAALLTVLFLAYKGEPVRRRR
ncbi:MAG: YfhO family protein [Acidobacteriota bacterium]|nr:YfhO family protein [Acidobacteriota bacterium]MDQ5870635.1 YfhO family protein [Acidobacteriota bacterium]